MAAAGFSLQEIKAGGFVEGLKAAGFSCREAKDAGYTPQECCAAGFSLEEGKAAGYPKYKPGGSDFYTTQEQWQHGTAHDGQAHEAYTRW